MAAKRTTWAFEKVNPRSSGSSGKIIDLFRNEGSGEPGFLQEAAPSYAANLMAREVIQNSWDAAEELRAHRPEVPPFAIDFEFQDRDAADKRELIDALALHELAKHASNVASTVDEREKLGLGAGDCLRRLGEETQLRVCLIVEHGASGMYGPWTGADSRMYLAMLSIGYNEKADGSGGTFGYGKAGLIRASHPRVVLAYSCFLERADDPGVTRRLLGVTYWGQHKYKGKSLNGFARFGDRLHDDDVVPFENEVADDVAKSLGISVRDPDVVEELGTTFLVIDPSVTTTDLRIAVERNWWPALLEDRFSVQITDTDGSRHPCRPRKNPQLASFVQAFDHHTTGTTPAAGKRLSLGTYEPQDGEALELGTLVLVAEPNGWSFPDETDGNVIDDRSLVGLMRDSRMIVEYHLPGRDISRRIPYVRGVFVAHPTVNVHLAKTEPKAHDSWTTNGSDDVPVASTKYSSVILERIKNAVRDFQEELRPPIDTAAAVRLSRLDQRLSRLRNQRGTTPPPPLRGDRPFAFRLDVRRVVTGDMLQLVGHVDVNLSPQARATDADAILRFAFALDEDGKRGSRVPLAIQPPAGFATHNDDDGRFEGSLGRTPVRFELRSDPYRHDWTGELLVDGTLKRSGADAGADAG